VLAKQVEGVLAGGRAVGLDIEVSRQEFGHLRRLESVGVG
jgi:hypothetical protein